MSERAMTLQREKFEAKALANPHLLLCQDLEEVVERRDGILLRIRNTGYAVVRGLFEKRTIEMAYRAVCTYANSATHHPSCGLARNDVRRNISKWSIGGRAAGDSIPRFSVVIYNPLFRKDRFGLHDVFRRIIEIRDAIAGRECLTDAKLMPDRFNACRMQIYPAGGGFLGEHRDLRGRANLPHGIFVETLLLLSEKGSDYQVGGGFVRHDGVTIDSENGTERADVVVYDAATIHGVHDVDPEVRFDARNLRGRAVAMVTIYDSR